MLKTSMFAVSIYCFALLASSAMAQDSELQTLQDALNLTPAQQDAWRTFAAASAPDPDQGARERAAAQMMPSLTAPQRVDLSIAVVEADLKTLERRGMAMKAFYATLTTAQRLVFDRQTAPHSEDVSEAR